MTKDTQTPIPAANAPQTWAQIMERNPAIFAEKGAPVAVLDPGTGKPNGLVITVLGKDSKTYRDALNDLSRDRAAFLIQNPSQKGVSPSADELAVVDAGVYAKCTVGANMTEFPSDKTELQNFYVARPDIREQIEKVVNSREAFMPPL